MRFSILVLVFFSHLAFGQSNSNAQKFVTVTGNVTGDTKGFNHVYLYGQGFKMDTVLIENSKFTFKIPYTQPCFPLFFTEYDVKQNKMYSPYGILIDGPFDYILKDIDLSKGMGSATLSGSKTAELYQEFTKGQKSVYAKIAEAMKAQKSAAGSDPKNSVIPMNSPIPFNSAKRDSLSKLLMTELVSDFVAKYPDEYVSAYVLSSSGRSSLALQDLEKCYSKLSDRMQKSAEGSNVQDYIKGIKNSAVGKMVENFILPDPAGKDLEWSSLKGKYILVDFWASWCGPCRQSFPHMRDIYKTYKEKNFEIYSISIDKDKAAWLKAVEQEQNP
ncbi:MAG: TlpA disulfide reductase family protein, partial [Verrucomicrobiota bacterium]